MKAFVQRVLRASVEIDGEVVSSAGRGLLVLFGVTHGDTPDGAARLAERTAKLRIFEDGEGKTNRSVIDVGGSVVVVSQFTLYADTRRGHRPGFSAAALPDVAVPVYERYVAALREILGEDRVGTGRFGADMKVSLVNDGPFSVELVQGAEQCP